MQNFNPGRDRRNPPAPASLTGVIMQRIRTDHCLAALFLFIMGIYLPRKMETARRSF